MTKKDYELIADALKMTKPSELQEVVYQWEMDVNAIMEVLAQDNGKFNPSRFLTACGLEVNAQNAGRNYKSESN